MSASRRTYRAPRGARDVLPEEMPAWELLEGTATRLARLFGYREIRPPVIEETELFTRSVGEVTDIVQKEMFTVEKGDSSYTLRPEGTAGVVRAYVQAGYAKTAPVQKLYFVGPMFRYERPQKGRERQFTQFDVECIGTLDPRADAELIHLAMRFFEELGLSGLEVRLNSMGDGDDRDRYRDAVRAFLAPTIGAHCELCRERYERNVLRVLDCKNPRCVELNAGAPPILEFLSAENREHFEEVRSSLAALGREAVVDPGIVRGMDYYTRTVFEVHDPRLGARSAVCGGGRYDHLVRDLGGPDVGAVGFAIGFTSTLVAMAELELLPEPKPTPVDAYVVAADPSCAREILRVADELRRAGVSTDYDNEAKSVKAQMRGANRGGAAVAVIVGPEELERGTVQVKALATGEQESVSRGAMAAAVRRVLAGTSPTAR